MNKKLSSDNRSTIVNKKKRNPLLYFGSVIVLVIIAVTFIGAPTIGQFAGISASTIFGYYDGHKIEHYLGNYFHRQILAINQNYRQNSEIQEPKNQFYTILQEAYQRTAFHVAILSYLENPKMSVSSEQVDTILATEGPYIVENKFNEELWSNTPTSQRKSNRDYVEEELLEKQFLKDLQEIPLSSKEIDFFQTINKTERKFRIAIFQYSELPNNKLSDFGQENTSLFRRMKFSRILFNSSESNADAKRALDHLKNGTKSFEELSRLYLSTDINTGGDIGWKYFYDLERDFENAESAELIFSLAPSEYSEILMSRFGPVIYRSDSEIMMPEFIDLEILNEVRNYLNRYNRGFIEDYYSEQAQNFKNLAATEGFNNTAVMLGTSTAESNFFPINFQNINSVQRVSAVDSNILQTAPYYQDFFKQAFKLKPKEISEPIYLDEAILLLELIEEKLIDDTKKNQLKNFHNYFVDYTILKDLETYIFESDLFINNFVEAVEKNQLVPQGRNTGPPKQAAF